MVEHESIVLHRMFLVVYSQSNYIAQMPFEFASYHPRQILGSVRPFLRK